MNYYNEHDPKIAAWLRGLIAAGLIPDGHVDTRSIAEVSAGDLRGFTQCHFFAGIAGWSYALQLAGWPAGRPVWTGSCPCQPFSAAGKGKGAADERHLWPEFYRLIRECRPDVVFGEQVESAIGQGWLDGVCADLEGEGYAVGSAVLGAHSVRSPHIRQRLYWVADSGHRERRRETPGRGFEIDARRESEQGCAHGGGVVLPIVTGLEGHAGHGDACGESGRVGTCEARPVAASGCWSESRLIQCRDGKLRRIPTESALFPLADGLSYRVGKRGSVRPALLHGAGNAIVPQVAATFIKAFLTS